MAFHLTILLKCVFIVWYLNLKSLSSNYTLIYSQTATVIAIRKVLSSSSPFTTKKLIAFIISTIPLHTFLSLRKIPEWMYFECCSHCFLNFHRKFLSIAKKLHVKQWNAVMHSTNPPAKAFSPKVSFISLLAVSTTKDYRSAHTLTWLENCYLLTSVSISWLSADKRTWPFDPAAFQSVCSLWLIPTTAGFPAVGPTQGPLLNKNRCVTIKLTLLRFRIW